MCAINNQQSHPTGVHIHAVPCWAQLVLVLVPVLVPVLALVQVVIPTLVLVLVMQHTARG